jgi:predicted nucleotidyltransferase
MNIGRKEELAEVRLTEIRNFLRTYWNEGNFSAMDMESYLKVTKEKTVELLDALINKEWVGKDENERYFPTNNAGSLIMAKAFKRISRDKAQQSYNDFINRVEEVNNNPYYLYYVRKVILFGSFLTDSEEVSDIDLAIELLHKDMGKGVDLVQVIMKRAAVSGKEFSSIIDKLDFAYQEVRLFLKNKSRVISFHPIKELAIMKCPTRIVFECVDRPRIKITHINHANKKV